MASRSFGDARWVVRRFGEVDDSYRIADGKLGSGTFGSVRLAQCRSSGVVRAIKTVPNIGDHALTRQIGGRMNEAEIMAQVDHPNIVRLFEAFVVEDAMHLMMERCGGGDFSGVLRGQGRLAVSSALAVMCQALYAVSYLHSRDIAHRDLKLENLLLLRDGPLEGNMVKVADFGLSCVVHGDHMTTLQVGTIRYSSPEVLQGRDGLPCDAWSCGVCMHALLSGRLPFDARTEAEVRGKIRRGNFSLSGPSWDVPEEAKDLVRGLLRFDPAERTTARAFTARVRAAWAPGPPPRLGGLVEALASRPRRERAALEALAWLTESGSLEALGRRFLALDADCDGALSAAELAAALPEREAPLAGAVAPMGFSDFVAMVRGQSLFLERRSYEAAFRALDRDGDGSISDADLARCTSPCGAECL